MLLGFDARRARLLLAEGQETANLMAQLRERAVINEFAGFLGSTIHDYIVTRYRSVCVGVKAALVVGQLSAVSCQGRTLFKGEERSRTRVECSSRVMSA